MYAGKQAGGALLALALLCAGVGSAQAQGYPHHHPPGCTGPWSPTLYPPNCWQPPIPTSAAIALPTSDLFGGAMGAAVQARTNRSANAPDSGVGAMAPLGYAAPATDANGAFDGLTEGRTADLNTEVALGPTTLWVRGAGRTGSYDGSSINPATDTTGGAVFAGLELPVSSTWLVGFAGGYSQTEVKTEGNVSEVDSDAWHASTYAAGSFGNWHVRAVVSYAHYELDSTRLADTRNGTAIATASYGADNFEALGEVSYALAVANLQVEPYAAFGMSWLNTDGYSESGAGSADLTMESEQQDWPYTLVGTRFAYPIADGSLMWVPTVDLAWRHVFGDVNPALSFTSQDTGSFAISGVPVATDAMVVGAGLEILSASGWRGSLKYTGDIASDTQQHVFMAGVGASF